MLQLHNVVKRFKKTQAVNHLNLEIPAGSIFGLLGPNGAGKTTTLRMIMNIIKPDEGEILFNGGRFRKTDYQQVGYLPEERGLYQKMKLHEMVLYLARLKGLSKSRATENVDRYLARFGLTQYADRKIEELSKGNQQKVQFIIAIIHEPELVILDEPFSGLDPVNQLLLKEIIDEMHHQGHTIIFSTHQMEQVEKLCDQICLINVGRKILYGKLKDIQQEYGTRTVSIGFSGSPEALEELQHLNVHNLTEDHLTGEIESESSLNDILKEVMQYVTVTRFRLHEPSLEQIFIDQVSGGEAQ